MAFEFQKDYDGSLSLKSAVYQAIGAASTCWESLENTGVFQDDYAREIAEALLNKIEQATRTEFE